MTLSNATAIQPSLMDISMVKSYLRCGKTTVYMMVKENGFPKPKKIRGASRWRRDEIDQWLDAQDETDSNQGW